MTLRKQQWLLGLLLQVCIPFPVFAAKPPPCCPGPCCLGPTTTVQDLVDLGSCRMIHHVANQTIKALVTVDYQSDQYNHGYFNAAPAEMVAMDTLPDQACQQLRLNVWKEHHWFKKLIYEIGIKSVYHPSQVSSRNTTVDRHDAAH